MSTNQIKGGVLLSYVIIFLTNGIGLVLTPFIIRSLGASEYGLYTMIGALIGYMTVLDFGLNSTIVRFVAKYRAENDEKGQENFLAHSFIMYGLIALVVVLVGIGLYFNLDTIYGDDLSTEAMYKAKVMFAILIFNLAFSLPGGAFNGICSGYEEFILPRIANITRYILRSALVVAILLYGGDSISLVVIDTIMNLLIVGVNTYIVFKKLHVTIRLHKFEGALLKHMLGYSIWIFVFALVHQLRWQFGQFILFEITSSTVVVAVYAVGTTLGNYFANFSSAISSVFLPRAMQMITASASSKELTDMFIKVSRIVLIILLYVLGGFVLVGEDFIYFWVGNDFSEAYSYTILIMLGLLLILSQTFALNIMEAKNKLKFRGITILILTVLGVVSGAILAKYYGGLGMIIGTVIFMLLERLAITWYCHNRLGLEMIRYYKELSSLFLVSFLLIVAAYYGFDYLPKQSVGYALIKGVVFTICYGVLFSMLVLNSYEKSLWSNSLSKVKNKFRRS